MPSLKTYLTAAGMVALAVADTIMITVKSNNTFSPDSVMAKLGDVLEFHFQSGNHSVVAGFYQYPCNPLPISTGFFSGFVDVKPSEPGKVFRVTVNYLDPLVFYSSQGDECSKGMVGIVNPNERQTLQSYRMRASLLARGVTPVTSYYGGELMDETASGKSNDGDDAHDDDDHEGSGGQYGQGSCGSNETSVAGKNETGVAGKNETGFGGRNDTGPGDEDDKSCGPKYNTSSVDMLEVPLSMLAVMVGAFAMFAVGL